jgi:glycerophosphoryl diester phosphodiesterase
MLACALAGSATAEVARRAVQVQGHRGAKASRPENTIPAFEFAIAQGVDALELDMAVTKDNVIVISHDPVLHPPVCTGPQPKAIIHDLTLAEVKQWDCGATRNHDAPKQQLVPGTRMPTLDEVFDLASKGTFDFNIETKTVPKRVSRPEAEKLLKQFKLTPEMEKDVIETITSVGPEVTPPPDEFARLVLEKIRKHHLEKRVILQSFDFRTLHAMNKLAPDIRLSALTSDQKRSFVEIAKEAGATIISPLFTTVTPEKVKEAHDAGLQVVTWTANRPDEWKRLVDAGVDAIITDDPEALTAWLRQNQQR